MTEKCTYMRSYQPSDERSGIMNYQKNILCFWTWTIGLATQNFRYFNTEQNMLKLSHHQKSGGEERKFVRF